MKSKLLLSVIYSLLWSSSYPQEYFKDITSNTGIDHAHISPPRMGGGIAVIDFNNDGFEDLYFTGGVIADKLYKNNGDKTYTDISIASGIDANTRSIHTWAVTSGDINNDGFEDIFIATGESSSSILLINNHDNTFSNTSNESGIAEQSVWSMGATLIDVNHDGFLDVYVINYIKSPSVILNNDGDVVGFDHECHTNHLYVNNKDGTFTEMAIQYGIEGTGCGLAVVTTDFNLDNKADIYVANDFGLWIEGNKAYQNEPNSSIFTDISAYSDLNVKLYGMGIAQGDVNRDGLIDYYVTNIGKNSLLINNSDGTYKDLSEEYGVSNAHIEGQNTTGWGTDIFDYNNDGYEDLFISNGYIGAAPFLNTSKYDPNKLFQNTGNGTFTDVSDQEAITADQTSRGMVTSDIDNDGDLDIIISNLSIVNNNTANVSVLENLRGNEKNWIQISLKDNEEPIVGSKVYAYQNSMPLGAKELSGGSSHASKKTNLIHYGLDDIDILDSIVVVWPDGQNQVFKDLQSNQRIMLTKNSNIINVLGCTDPSALNFNSKATYNSACIIPDIDSEVIITNTTDSFGYEKENISLYPNPASSSFNINVDFKLIPQNKHQKLTLVLTDLQGEIQLRHIIQSSHENIESSHLSSGVYICSVGNLFRQKVLIQHDF